MIVKFKKLTDNAIVPSYATDGSNGIDLTAISMKTVNNTDYGYIEYCTGISIEMPKGYAGYLLPRSSISKTGLIMANSIGLIDNDYTGELKFRFKYIAGSEFYKVGDKIGQLVIIKTPKFTLEEVSELTETKRGSGGFGHSNDIIY